MIERPGRADEPAAPAPPAPAESARARWDVDDDELLLLDELEESDEAPDDERSDALM